jgi:outer membrane protein assembly factor BamA
VQSYAHLVRATDDDVFDYDETVGEIGTAVTYGWVRADWESRITLGYLYTEQQVIAESADAYEDERLRPADLFEGRTSALWAHVAFFNPTAFPRSHSWEDGRYLSAVVDWASEHLGGELERVRVRGDGAEYISLPWGRNHVLKLEGTAGTSFGDDTAQGAFGVGGVEGLGSITDSGVRRNVWLRGYRENTQVGEHVVKAGLAYRFPVFSLYHGVTPTLPWYLHQGFIEVFYEGGTAWNGTRAPDEKEWLNSMGVEFNVSMTLFRFLDIAPGLGVAYVPERDEQRFDDGEEDTVQVYLTLKSTVNF